MDVSVITVTKNSARTIERTVRSIMAQSGVKVQHIIKDANSSDDTLEIAKAVNPEVLVICQPDKGIYDAMNQGYSSSVGEVVAFLNSDDFYMDENVLSDVMRTFNEYDCDYVYGNIQMVTIKGRVQRVWSVGEITERGLLGEQIPHPALFIRRHVLDQLKLPFDASYRISADLKQQVQIINQMKCKGQYLDRVLTVMEIGGESTNSLKSYFRGWKESVRAYNEVMGSGGVAFVIRKVILKIKGVRLN
jgi:glycosyltransferase involved in cell wall biosynthesis